MASEILQISYFSPSLILQASERERSHRGGEGYYPSASWGMSRSGSKVTFAEEGGDSPQDATGNWVNRRSMHTFTLVWFVQAQHPQVPLF